MWRSIESTSFLVRFGPLEPGLDGRLAVAGGDGQPLGDIAHDAMTKSHIASKLLVIPDLRGERKEFVAQAFFNQHNLLIMVSKRKATRFGRRVRAEAS